MPAVYCLVRRADLFVLLTGSLLEGAKASRFFMVKPVLARLGLSDPVQTLLFKAATVSCLLGWLLCLVC